MEIISKDEKTANVSIKINDHYINKPHSMFWSKSRSKVSGGNYFLKFPHFFRIFLECE